MTNLVPLRPTTELFIMRDDTAPGWRNRQTPGTQNPVGRKARVGSTPTPGTKITYLPARSPAPARATSCPE